MAIVIYTNRKNGCKYAYESTYQWSEEHQQSRPKRKYLGRVDDDGNIIYSSHQRGGARVRSPMTEARRNKAEGPSDDVQRLQKLYEETERDRQECMRKIHDLEAELSAAKTREKKLLGVIDSIHKLSSLT